MLRLMKNNIVVIVYIAMMLGIMALCLLSKPRRVVVYRGYCPQCGNHLMVTRQGHYYSLERDIR